ncbi:MAG TPA: DUF2752 domain-containing protein [Deltaproteobacteria bacterium]|nr:DUF2752 domain-containing protein [Deltaproteobacteria bacterium]
MSPVLRWIDRLGSRWWFGEGFVIAVCAAIVVASMVMSTSAEVVTLFGQEVPVLCSFRRLTGVGCPGCGLTRSFVFVGHGRILEAFWMNPLGPLAYLAVAGQIPWRGYQLLRKARARRAA